MAGEILSEDEIRELQAREAWAVAQDAAQARMAPAAELPPIGAPPPPPPPPSMDVNSLPNAPPTEFAGAKVQGEAPIADEAPTPPPAAALPPAPKEAAAQPAALEQEPEMPRPSPGVLIPGGMQPYTETRQVKYGKVVAPGVRDANVESGQLQLDAADHETDANATLHQHERDAATAKMLANESAMAQQQRLAEERDRMVGDRLAEIELLNKKAQGEPGEIWGLPHIAARFIGFLALMGGAVQMATGGKGGAVAGIAMGMTGKFIDGLVNQDINAKLNERNQAAAAAGKQINLLHLHQERMGNREKAIQATKLAYYDNILTQMDAYKADNAGLINEANWERMRADVLTSQAKAANMLGMQEQADVTDELTNKMRAPQMLGGAGAGAGNPPPRPENVLTMPDGSSATVDKAIFAKVYEKVAGYTELVRFNESILEKRAKIRALDASYFDAVRNPKKYAEMRALVRKVDDEVESKIKIMSQSEDKSVVREAEKEAALQKQAGGARGLGMAANDTLSPFGKAYEKGHDEMLQNQIKRANDAAYDAIHTASGDIVEKGFARDPSGNLVATGKLTGRTLGAIERMPPKGFKPKDPDQEVATAKTPMKDTAKKGADHGSIYPTPAAHHGRKKKK